jgi:hypothetical protein
MFVSANGNVAAPTGIAKVEIFEINDAMRSMQNPDGLVLKETLVSNGGSNPAIFPYPSLTHTEYWETHLFLDPDQYRIADHVDRWHIITDPDVDLEGPIALLPLSESTAHTGWSQTGTGSDGGGNFSLYEIDLGPNKILINNNISTAISALVTPQEVIDDINDPDLQPHNSSVFQITSATVIDPSTFIGIVVRDYAVQPNGAHTGGDVYAYFRTIGDFAGGTVDEVHTTAVTPNPAHAGVVTQVLVTLKTDMRTLEAKVYWSGASPSVSKIVPYFCRKWNLNVEYDPNQPNAWDDLIARTQEYWKTAIDNQFKVNSELWMTSPRPIIADYTWKVDPAEIFVQTKTYLRITVEPRIPLNPEAKRYHYAMIAQGKLRYEHYRIKEDGITAVKISSGTIFWHEENTALMRLDTTAPPLNRNMDTFVVFYLDLPDGTTIRSPRITVSIVDDTKRFIMQPYSDVF